MAFYLTLRKLVRIDVARSNPLLGYHWPHKNTDVLQTMLLPPANEVCEGYVFTGVCLSTGGDICGKGACVAGGMHGGGVCMVGGKAWQGDVHGRGACVRCGGHAW